MVAVPSSSVNPQPPTAPDVATTQIPVMTTGPKPVPNPAVLGAPPEYTYHVPPTHYAAAVPMASAAGLPVQVQVDGRTLSATLMQDVSL